MGLDAKKVLYQLLYLFPLLLLSLRLTQVQPHIEEDDRGNMTYYPKEDEDEDDDDEIEYDDILLLDEG